MRPHRPLASQCFQAFATNDPNTAPQTGTLTHPESASLRVDGGQTRSPPAVVGMQMEIAMKKYIKPDLVKLGNIELIKSNHTGPSSDGKKYSGFFK